MSTFVHTHDVIAENTVMADACVIIMNKVMPQNSQLALGVPGGYCRPGASACVPLLSALILQTPCVIEQRGVQKSFSFLVLLKLLLAALRCPWASRSRYRGLRG